MDLLHLHPHIFILFVALIIAFIQINFDNILEKT